MTLSALSASLSALANRVAPSVVAVDARRRSPATGTLWADGLVLVAAHVLERDDDLSVGLPDGREVPATLVGADPGTDLALLRADTASAVAPDWAADTVPDLAALTLTIARPGRAARASFGIVAARAGEWRTRGGGRLDARVDLDARVYPGWSGGLVVDADGRVVGLATTALTGGPGVIPAATVRRVAAALAEGGRVRRAWLGVATQPVGLEGDQRSGLLVVSVQKDSPASAAGILLGDAILAFDGAPVRSVGDLIDALDGDRVGTPVSVRVLRAGAEQDVVVTPGAR